ncbi:MAG: response regulator transcription factor [Alphaproteobacteria bacterium]|nr:response regulator transcription factor [Alphaproteobacteria bacterium]MBF0393387.1 response regulator transcription factor [Alphaproteobacteria bacterium]
MERTRIVIAEDHELIRQAVSALLSAEPNLRVVGEAADGLAAVAMARDLVPDVVLMDLSMPEMDGVQATREIKKRRREVKVLILTVAHDERRVAEALRAGADGYALKKAGRDQLVRAITDVCAGRLCLWDGIDQDLVRHYMTEGCDARPLSNLTDRERQVLKLIAEGNKNKEVADKLGISAKTVETHRARIMQKLDVHSGVDLTRVAHREGLVEQG